MPTKESVTFFNFSGGLHTEATPFNIEPNHMTSAENIVIDRDGSVRRRRGFDFIGSDENGEFYNELSGYSDSAAGTGDTYDLYDPPAAIFMANVISPNNNLNKYVFAHIGSNINIYQFDSAAELKEINDPLASFPFVEAEAKFYKSQIFQDRGKIFVINPVEQIFYLEQDSSGVFERNDVDIFARNDESDVITRTITTRPGGMYRAPETGRATGDDVVKNDASAYLCILNHTSAADNEPGTGDNWKDYWVVWGPAAGLSLAAWATATDYVSNVNYVDTYNGFSFTKGLFLSGRLWLIGHQDAPNTVYFSQVVGNDSRKYGRMYQEADPLSAPVSEGGLADSELVATDGGTLVITGADKILNLVPFFNGVVVFATNGVWYVRGADGFTATDFTVDQISEHGLVGENATIAIENAIVYAGRGHIFVLQANDEYSNISPTPLTTKIQSLYTDIPKYNRELAELHYNPQEGRIFYLYNNGEEEWITANNKYKQSTHFREMLIYDIALKSWYPHSLPTDAVGTDAAIATMAIIDGGNFESDNTVVTLAGDTVVDDSGNIVIAYDLSGGDEETVNAILIMKPDTASDVAKLAWGVFEGDTLQDFSLVSAEASSYSSDFTTAHQTFGDVIHTKQWPYMYLAFKRVETGTIDVATGLDENPGGCKMRTLINWATGSTAFRYGTLRSVYFPDKFTFSPLAGADPEIATVWNKLKLRGRGNVIQFEFQSDGDKDYQLYGWQLVVAANKRI